MFLESILNNTTATTVTIQLKHKYAKVAMLVATVVVACCALVFGLLTGCEYQSDAWRSDCDPILLTKQTPIRLSKGGTEEYTTLFLLSNTIYYSGAKLSNCLVDIDSYQTIVDSQNYSTSAMSSTIKCDNGISMYSTTPLNTGADLIVNQFRMASQWLAYSLKHDTSAISYLSANNSFTLQVVEPSVASLYLGATYTQADVQAVLAQATSFTGVIRPYMVAIETNTGIKVQGFDPPKMVAFGTIKVVLDILVQTIVLSSQVFSVMLMLTSLTITRDLNALVNKGDMDEPREAPMHVILQDEASVLRADANEQ
ncbi:hypothetical protein HDU80_001135 [Chytriomyces hyalinus]|nr:hypothetical protein HDU80_001135 [Chytriomyces hyalinus]